MPSKLQILHVSPSFYPATGYGGPIHSTKLITDGIARTEGFQVNVLTTDTANPNNKDRLNLVENPARMLAGYTVRYCRSVRGRSISLDLFLSLLGDISRADLVHLTGPYNFPVVPTLLICRLTKTPLVWSPRGGFQATTQWEDAPKKLLKKTFERICAVIGSDKILFHVTAPTEANACRINFPKARSVVIPNAIEIPEKLPKRTWRPNGRLRLAFLSRIHPKKGLDILIPALAQLPDYVTLDIYGEGDNGYVSMLNTLVSQHNLSERVYFRGHVEGPQKTRAFTSCDIFVLPTYSENFGIVIAEALAHGTPVVTTKGAPWSRIEKENCGCWTDVSTNAVQTAIASIANSDLLSMGKNGRSWMEREFSSEKMTKKFEHVYTRLIARDMHEDIVRGIDRNSI